MANIPGMPGSQVSNESDIMRKLADIDRRIRELAAQDVLAPVGITAQPNGITVNGSETVNGPLNVNGPMVVTGTLSLPAGIIGNDALTDPISPLATHSGTNNFGLATGANQQIISTTINVPTGYSQALVFATATMHAYNNGVTDDAYLAMQINGTSVGASSQTSAAASLSVTVPATGTALLSGLGSTFKVAALASSGSHAWAASSVNFVNLDIMTVFLR